MSRGYAGIWDYRRRASDPERQHSGFCLLAFRHRPHPSQKKFSLGLLLMLGMGGLVVAARRKKV